MKTLFKNFKTVAAIFLALVIYSCDDELIEQQDVSNTNQEFSKKPSNSSKPVKYCGSFVAGNFGGAPNLLISRIKGKSSSKGFTIQWFPGCNSSPDCPEVFDPVLFVTHKHDDVLLHDPQVGHNPSGLNSITYSPKYSVGFHVYGKRGEIIGFQIWMRDEFDNSFVTDNEPLDPRAFPVIENPGDPFTIVINKIVELYRYTGKGQKRREGVGKITIGTLLYEVKDLTCECWDPCNSPIPI